MPKVAVFLLSSLAFVFQALGKKGNGPFPNTTVRGYDFTIASAYLTDLNPKYFGPGTFLKVEGPNDFAYQVDLLRDLPADALSLYSAYEKNNRNEYVPSITVRGTVCGDYDKERKGLPLYKCLRNYEAGAKECPFKKGVYKIKASCTPADCPVMLPGRYWKINNTWITPNNELLFYRIFEIAIHRKIKIG